MERHSGPHDIPVEVAPTAECVVCTYHSSDCHSSCSGPNDVPAEKSGTGANGYTYFVCNHLGGPLSRLPPVKPAQIKAARQVKKFVTGKLDTQVSTLACSGTLCKHVDLSRLL